MGRALDFDEVHADVESEGPVGGECDEAGVEPQRILPHVKKNHVVLDLAAEEPQGPLGQRMSSPTVNSTSRSCRLFRQRQLFPSRWKDIMSGYSSAIAGSRVAMASHTAGRMWGGPGFVRDPGPAPRRVPTLKIVFVDVHQPASPGAGFCLHSFAGRFDVGAVAVRVTGIGKGKVLDPFREGGGVRVRCR